MLEMASVRVAVLTISDSAVAGTRADLSGPALTGLLSKSEQHIVETGLVGDDQRLISTKLVEMSSRNNVVITTGGTGFSPRDVTPEATLSIIEKRCSGLEVALHSLSLQATPMAALSRAVAGIRGNCLIVNMPGSPKAVKECWEVLEPILGHAVSLLSDTDDGNLHKKMQSQ